MLDFKQYLWERYAVFCLARLSVFPVCCYFPESLLPDHNQELYKQFPLVRISKQKPKERDRDEKRNYYNTSV